MTDRFGANRKFKEMCSIILGRHPWQVLPVEQKDDILSNAGLT